MKFFNRIIPWLCPLLVLLGLEQLLNNPKQIYWLSALIILFVILSVWQLVLRQVIKRDFWQLCPPLVLFLASGILFVSFLEGVFLRQFFIVILILSLLVSLESIYLKFHFRPKYQVHSLDNIYTHLSLLTIFFSASGFFALLIFFGIPLWILALIFLIENILLNYQLLWSSDSNLKTGWPYLFVISLINVELFLAVSFLPSSMYVNSLIVSLSYYLIAGLTRNWLLGIKESRVVSRYLIIGVVSLVIILATAKWF